MSAGPMTPWGVSNMADRKHPYPSRHRPGTHWATDESWRLLDRLPVGLLPDDYRFLLGGMIAGALMKARAEARIEARWGNGETAGKAENR